ncbi:MAG: AsnC family transcriptional regulator [Alphaproteobacteria bacterium]|nr:MAG: AsnC family transcriptional regulator [Alphaproteobacteria bacterium]
MEEIDQFDRHILAALQQDGRLTNQQLGERVNLSPSQCSRRRARLEAAGLIEGYSARLNRERLDYGLTAFISVMLNKHNRDNARRFAELMRRLPNVQEAHALTGEMDYLIKLVARNLKELSAIISDELMPHESVQTVKSAIVLDTIKEGTTVPLD